MSAPATLSPEALSLAVTLLLEAFVKGTVLLLIAGGVAVAFRRASAATRHSVWACALAASLVIPLLSSTLPPWSTAPLDRFVEARVAGPLASLLLAGNGAALYGGAPDLGRTAAIDMVLPEGSAARTNTAIAPSTQTEAGPVLLVAVWLLGAVVACARLAGGIVQRARLAAKARPLRQGDVAVLTRRLVQRLGVKRPVRLMQTPERTVPMTWGWLRPVVLLPEEAGRWPLRRLRAVLVHELAHVRRADAVTRTIAQVACILFWYHPLVWVTARTLAREQERACDDVVLLAGTQPAAYAEALLEIVHEFRTPRPAPVGALAVARRTRIEYRVRSILDPRRERAIMPRLHRTVLVAAVAAVVLPLAALRPLAAAQESTTEPTRIELVVSGGVELATSVDELRLEPGAKLRILEHRAEATDAGAGEAVSRELSVTADDSGELAFEYSADGVAAPFDEKARAWADEVLSHTRKARYARTVKISEPKRVKVVVEPEIVEVGPRRVKVLVEPHVEIGTEGIEVVVEPETVDVGADRVDIIIEPEIEVLRSIEPFDVHIETDTESGESHTVTLRLSTSDEDDPELVTLHEIEPITLSIIRENEGDEVTVVSPRIVLRRTDDEDDSEDSWTVTMESGGDTGMARAMHIERSDKDEPVAWTIEESGEDEVRHIARISGEVELAARVDDLRLGPDGEVVLEEHGENDSKRVLRVTSADGSLRIEWTIDGEVTDFDADARAWAEEMLARLLDRNIVRIEH